MPNIDSALLTVNNKAIAFDVYVDFSTGTLHFGARNTAFNTLTRAHMFGDIIFYHVG